MKVTQIRVAGQSAWPHLTLPSLDGELNVMFGPPRCGKSTIAHLMSHLLYGKTASAWRRELGQAIPQTEGALEVESTWGRFVLRRHRDASPGSRLTVASATGAAVDGRTVHTLLGGLAPSLLAELYTVDFAEFPRPQRLLEGEFARQFTLALGHERAASAPSRRDSSQGDGLVDRQRVDDLVRRRDDIVVQLQHKMSARRCESAALEQELAHLHDAISKRRDQAEELASRLNAVHAKLAEIDARLRFYALQSSARLTANRDSDRHRDALSRLDAEALRCRQMLNELQSRETTVRRELAECGPDDAGAAGAFAAQRATVGVMERLLDDFEAEACDLASARRSGRDIEYNAPGRFAPVATMLRRQLYALCGQISEHERSQQRERLKVELRRLARAQADLGDQLEALLERRQSLVCEEELTGRTFASQALPPVEGQCRCERHDEFIRNADDALLNRAAAENVDNDRARRLELEAQRDQLRNSCDSVQRELDALTSRWETIQRQRAQAVDQRTFDELQAELGRLEIAINATLLTPTRPSEPLAVAPHRRVWKASDALAQLSGGQLLQIRLCREGREATVIDREGRSLNLDQLTPGQQDQLFLALVLALTTSLGNRGVELPLVLDEPFLRQDASSAVAMAGVLVDYAREGRQTFVLTEDRDAVRRFQTFNVKVWNIDEERRGGRSSEGPASSEVKPAPAKAPTIRIVRESAAPGMEGAPTAERHSQSPTEGPIHYLTTDGLLADFPVLGADTAPVFSRAGIATVEDLLAADANDVARRLTHPLATVDAVRLWQRHMSLMCFVPGMTLADAQVLAACDVHSPEALFSIDHRLLADAVTAFLNSDRGRRFASSRDRFAPDRLALLQKQARRHIDRWRLACARYAWVDRPTASSAPTTSPRPRKSAARLKGLPAAPRIARTPHPQAQRYLLDLASPVARAPSLGRTMARRLAQVGIRTVGDLLNADAASAAQELQIRRVDAAAVARWQSQARLACRIPKLRSVAAQLLVACGLCEPEQIAGANEADLVGRVRSVCRTAEGRRILRDGKAPSRHRIAAWIRLAAHPRPLEAA